MLKLLESLAPVIFLVSWVLGVGGRILWMLERSSVRHGGSRAATGGLLLARERAWVTSDETAHEKRIDLDQALARWTSPDTLLFAPTSNYYHAFALDWFGRAHRSGNEFVLEARLSAGQTISLSGWIIFFMALTVASALAGWYWVTAVVIAVGILCVRSYRRSLRDQKDLARRIVQEVRAKLQRAA